MTGEVEYDADQSPDSSLRFWTEVTHTMVKSTHGQWSIADIDNTDLESFFEFLFYTQEEETVNRLF